MTARTGELATQIDGVRPAFGRCFDAADSRTSDASTSFVVPATDAWVMRAGCSISDSTAPRLSASVNRRVRLHVVDRAASRRRRGGTTPCRRSRGRGPLATFAIRFEERGDGAGVVLLAFDPDGQRAHAAQQQPAVERRRDRAGGVLQEADPLGQRVVVRERPRRRRRRCGRRGTWSRSARRRRRRARAAAAGTGVANVLSTTSARADGVRRGGDGADVDGRERRVGRRLAPHQRRVVGERLVERGRVAQVDRFEAQPRVRRARARRAGTCRRTRRAGSRCAPPAGSVRSTQSSAARPLANAKP